MIRTSVFAVLAFVLVAPLHAQTPEAMPVRSQSLVGEAPRGAEMSPASRLFEIRDGGLWMDGQPMPPEAVPSGLDLSGIVWWVELVGPVTPVVQVDGTWFVLEDERLVPLDESSSADNSVFIMGEELIVPSASPEARLAPVVNEAYRRQLSEADQALYRQMEREAQLEQEITGLAYQLRALPPGPQHDALAADLRQRLRTLFDLKQEIRAEELDRAEAEIRELKETLKARAAIGDEIVDHRFRELLGQ